VRKAKPFKPGDHMTHGLYAKSKPPEEVRRIMEEGIEGVEEEIVGLRMLARELLERLEEAGDGRSKVRLLESYTLAARRLGDLIKAEKERKEGKKANPREEELMSKIDRMSIGLYGEPISEQVRKEALESEPELETAGLKIVEEMAGIRYSLRKMFRMAEEAEDVQELSHLVNLYGESSKRLSGLLKQEKSESGKLERYLKECFDEALQAAVKELGLEDL